MLQGNVLRGVSMRKLKSRKKDFIYLAILVIFMLVIISLFNKSGYYFGSAIDWINQHISIPDYFRKEFYATGNLIPDFAGQIGGGQNIFNFSYYGLLSPIILFSYLLPMVPMYDYLIMVSILSVVISAVLMYIWLRKNNLKESESFVSTLFFVLATPLIYHSHRHMMFVNYMPFLILALIGIDSYFKKKKRILMVLGIFLMIMTSYYYSVSGICAASAYAVYKYLITNKDTKFKIKDFLIEGAKYAGHVVVAVLMAGVLILPTLSALMDRMSIDTESSGGKSFISLVLPNGDFSNVLYSSYGMGLTAFFILVIIGLLTIKDRHTRFLGVVLGIIVVLPVFTYILNGTLYSRSKVLIPFLTLAGLGIGIVIRDIRKILMRFKPFIVTLIVIVIIGIIKTSGDSKAVFFVDMTFVLLSLWAFVRWKKKVLLYATSLIIALISCIVSNQSESFVAADVINDIYNSDKQQVIDDVLDKELYGTFRSDDLTRTKQTGNNIYNANFFRTSIYSSAYVGSYNKLFHDTFSNPNPACNRLNSTSSNNIIFETLMGVKYAVSKSEAPIGYEFVEQCGDYKIYRNDHVFSLGYAASDIMSLKEYDKLDTCDQMIALLKYVIVDKDISEVYSDLTTEEKDIELPISKSEEEGYLYHYKSNTTTKFTVNTPENYNDKIYIIDIIFDKELANDDIRININGIKQVLSAANAPYPNKNYTFRYVISSNEAKNTLKFELNEGDYYIKDVKVRSIDYDDVKGYKAEKDEFVMNERKTDNIITGSVDVTKDGYFALTIPNADGFTAYVDGKVTDIETVDTSFIGFEITKGHHDIKIVYNAPKLKAGKMLSITGVILFTCLIVIQVVDFKKKNKKEKE